MNSTVLSTPVAHLVSSNLDSLAGFQPFQDLSAPVLSAIESMADLRDYKKGETLVSQGQYEGEVFFVVASGQFNTTKMNPQSGAMIVDQAEAGDTIGLSIALCEDGNEISLNMTISAKTDGKVYIIDSQEFRDIISNRPSLAKSVLFYLAEKVVDRQFSSIEFSGAPEQKIYKTLLDMIERDELSGFWHIPNMPKHRNLADMSLVAEEDAANAVAVLIQNGIAKRQYPGLVIEDMQRLNKLAR